LTSTQKYCILIRQYHRFSSGVHCGATMTYLSLLQKPGAPPPLPTTGCAAFFRPSYLSLLQPKPAVPLPEGALAGSTAFALAYNALLTTGHPASLASRLTTLPQSPNSSRVRPLLDGKPLNKTLLVELLHAIMPAWPADAEPPSIDILQRAATAHAFAAPAADPWLTALRGWLAHEIVTSVWLARTSPGGRDEGPIANLSFASRTGHGDGTARIPYWFVSHRDIKAELNAYGPEAMRRIRVAMKTLGWRERKCYAWGGQGMGLYPPRDWMHTCRLSFCRSSARVARKS
jgi:hypothetical protein